MEPTITSSCCSPLPWSLPDLGSSDLQVLCSNSDFMSFFFQHVASCPPRGPFRYYSALTFLVRARERYAPLASPPHTLGTFPRSLSTLTASDHNHTKATGKESAPRSSLQKPEEKPMAPSDSGLLPHSGTAVPISSSSLNAGSTAGGGTTREWSSPAEKLYQAIHIQSILALMEQKFATGHLSSWPLFYVLSGVHCSDVEKMILQQRQQQMELLKEPAPESSSKSLS